MLLMNDVDQFIFLYQMGSFTHNFQNDHHFVDLMAHLFAA